MVAVSAVVLSCQPEPDELRFIVGRVVDPVSNGWHDMQLDIRRWIAAGLLCHAAREGHRQVRTYALVAITYANPNCPIAKAAGMRGERCPTDCRPTARAPG